MLSYSLFSGLLGLTPAANDGTPGSLSHLLNPCEEAVTSKSEGDGNHLRSDICRYPKDSGECSACVCPYCQVRKNGPLYTNGRKRFRGSSVL